MKTLLDLNGKWSLYIVPNKEVKKLGLIGKTENELKAAGISRIDGSVPGNFELDMMREGLLPDLFFGENPLLAQKLENRHLWYTREFDYIPDGAAPSLLFEGIDTYGEIYLNGELIGKCDNMLIAHEFPATSIKEGKNELTVHILPTTIEARQFKNTPLNSAQHYNHDSINVRKAGYMFGWDIFGRFVSGGIWRPVSLISKSSNRIDEFYIATSRIAFDKRMGKDIAHINAFLHIEVEEDLLDGYEIEIVGTCGEKSFKKRFRPWGVNCVASLRLDDYLLWWPKGKGEQNLYDVEANLYLNGELCDSYNTRFGIRTVKLERTSVIDPEKGGKFEFIINGVKTFIMGTNWVPLDSFPSRNTEHLDAALELVDDIGCNMIRCWGGGIYEEDRFYDLCDEKGILIWQDFAMGCAIYPQTEEFCAMMAKEAEAVIKRLRSHPCLALWAGDNECDCAYGWRFGNRIDPNSNVITRKVLPDQVAIHDPFRDFLPSSPYIDSIAWKTKLPIAEDHLWGPRDYFKGNYYANSVCAFASETGYHGCPSPDSLKKYIDKDHLWSNFRDNGRPDPQWLVHAASMETDAIGPYEYRIGLMNRQVTEIFGEPTKDNLNAAGQLLKMFGNTAEEALDDYAKASQISQAEAQKYFIERFRIRKDVRGGIIWWNILDGWPQISDAVVDYYKVKKLAYSYTKNSQAPVCLMMDEPDENNVLTLFAANDTMSDVTVNYTVSRVSSGDIAAEGEVTIEANGLSSVCKVALKENEKDHLLIEWSDKNGLAGKNHYTTNIHGISFEKYLEFLKKTNIGKFEGFGE